MYIIEASENPIILNEYTSKKEYLKNKEKIEKLKKESEDIDSEDKLNSFLKKNLKNIEDINRKIDQKKYINNTDKFGISLAISTIGLVIAKILSNNSNPIGTIISMAISILSLITGIIHKVVKHILNNNDNKDRENMKIFCDKLRINLSKNIKDPTDIKDPKLRNSYLKLMHELDISSSKLIAISYSKNPYDYKYDRDTVASSDEIKYRTNLLKQLFSKLSSYIDFSDINFNEDSDIRNFISGYHREVSIGVYIKNSIDYKDLKSTFKTIEKILKNMSNDDIEYILDVPEDTFDALDYILYILNNNTDDIDEIEDEDDKDARYVTITLGINKK